MEAWYLAKPAVLKDLIGSLERHYPTLQISLKDWGVIVYGRFPVRADAEIIDWYQIEVHLWGGFPISVPLLFEIGGKIPRDIKYHVYSDSGSACLFTPEERYKHWPIGASFLDFLRGPVNEFFLSQFFFQHEGYWIFGDRGHGTNGLFEFYGEQLGVKDRATLTHFIQLLCKDISPHKKCPCGELRLGRCHYQKLAVLQKRIPRAVFKMTLSGIALEERDIAIKVIQMEIGDTVGIRLPVLKKLQTVKPDALPRIPGMVSQKVSVDIRTPRR